MPAGVDDALFGAAAVAPGDRVLDVGCGAGATTRIAARLAAPGYAVGVDVSAPLLARARASTAAEGIANATYECADAQAHAFAAGGYDVVVSRGGVRFFADRAAAFRNLARALRPGGRLAFVCPPAAGTRVGAGPGARPARRREDGPGPGRRAHGDGLVVGSGARPGGTGRVRGGDGRPGHRRDGLGPGRARCRRVPPVARTGRRAPRLSARRSGGGPAPVPHLHRRADAGRRVAGDGGPALTPPPGPGAPVRLGHRAATHRVRPSAPRGVV
ncbi:methyltransferase domain-containing protein [Streptomyces sp. NPDC057781]|uniref:class I SAM-dependent methyltransferase n=1 Tax=unclassified Streptomyces TaxID=2593676 RepID=UPI003673BF2E